MAIYICPWCGSRYMQSSRKAPKTIFQIDANSIEMVQAIGGATSTDISFYKEIYCASCSWQGTGSQLTKSDIY